MNSVILEGNKDTYKILISFNAQCEIEDLLGESIFETVAKPASLNIIRNIFMIGLRYGENRKVTSNQAGEIAADIISKHDYEYLQAKVVESITKGLGLKEQAEETESEETEGK